MSNDCKPHNPQSVTELFPEWDGQPEDRTQEWSCPDLSWTDDPYILTVLLTDIVRQFISNPHNVRNPNLQQLLESGAVDVTMMAHWDAKAAGVLPRIVVDFAGMAANPPFAKNDQILYDSKESTGTYRVDWKIQFELHILAKTKVESTLLATSIRQLCSLPFIRDQLHFLDFRVIQQSRPQLIGEDSSNMLGFSSAVTAQGVVASNTYYMTADPKLKRIRYHTGGK